jgi:hypothetical protein
MPAFVALSWMAERTILAFAFMSLPLVFPAAIVFSACLMVQHIFSFAAAFGGFVAVKLKRLSRQQTA